MKYPFLQDISDTDGPSRNIKLTSNKFHIGRLASNSFVVINNIGFIPEQITIERNQKRDWILVNKSCTSTQVNGVKLQKNQNHILKEGDIISLGEALKYVFKYPDRCSLTVTNHLQSTVSACKREHSEDTNEDNINSKRIKLDDDTHDELRCSVCMEMFVGAQTLSCSHTFCKYCINQWRKNHNDCPICRRRIYRLTPTLVLDNMIQNIVENSTKEIQDYRRAIINARKPNPKR